MLLCTSTVSTLFCKYLVGISFTGNHFKISLAAWGGNLIPILWSRTACCKYWGLLGLAGRGGGGNLLFPSYRAEIGIRRGIKMGTEIGGKN